MTAAALPAVAGTLREGSARATGAAFALAGVVVGAISTGINFFVLLYYHQVLGLDPLLAGLALALALVIDGIADPLVGWLSDRWRSRLGRRHPFLYASILPMAAAYVALWYPPVGADQQGWLFVYLLATTVALRLSITLFDVPTNALIPELTGDYDRRTAWAQAKTSLNWATANVVGIVAYGVFLADAPGAPAGSGVLRQSGHQAAALWTAGLVFAAALAVPLLLRPWIPHLARARPRTGPATPGAVLRDVVAAYTNPALVALLASAVFFAAGMGLTQALWVYFLSFFWSLSETGVNVVQTAYLVAAVTAWIAVPRAARGRDKRRLAIGLSVLFWLIDVAPIALRLGGLMPGNASPALIPTLVVFAFLDGLLINAVLGLVLSMLTDVVEDNQVRTGRRDEGLVLAGQTLVTKAAAALGTILGSAVLLAVKFPEGEAATSIGPDVAFRLGATFVGAMWLLGIASTVTLTRYGITRARHQANLAAIPGEHP